MKEEVLGGWRKLHNELHNLNVSQNIITVIKSQSARLVGNIARMVEIRNYTKFSLKT
jgi:hypothetical protein